MSRFSSGDNFSIITDENKQGFNWSLHTGFLERFDAYQGVYSVTSH